MNKLATNETSEIIIINLKLSIPKFFKTISSFLSIKLISKNCAAIKKIKGKIFIKIEGALRIFNNNG
jgi:hypothetical protein